jgi:5'-deoxynucleotidase YfbR-like HD superfamily hydrolase
MEETQKPVRRLCSEIQLFDLCDLDCCGQKDGRFCTDSRILERFEAIKEEDESASQQYLAEEFDDEDEGEGEESYGEEYEDEEI